jgi:protein Mpv17
MRKGFSLWTSYLRLLHKNPLSVKMFQTGVFMGTGDIICQGLEGSVSLADGGERGRTTPFDWLRCLRMASFGAVISAPGMHVFYAVLDKKIPDAAAALASSKSAGLLTLTKRVVADQLLFAPAIVTAFFLWDGCLQGFTQADLRASLELHWLEAIKLNYVVWPGAMYAAFLVPTPHRVMFVNSVQVAWSCVLSYVNAQ